MNDTNKELDNHYNSASKFYTSGSDDVLVTIEYITYNGDVRHSSYLHNNLKAPSSNEIPGVLVRARINDNYFTHETYDMGLLLLG